MRMWMVSPKIMCHQHLLGEHVEIHMFIGTMKKQISVHGYIKNNLLEMESIISRHEKLVEEMTRRGIDHKSPLEEDVVKEIISHYPVTVRDAKVNVNRSLKDLLSRCPRCKKNYEMEELEERVV